MKALMRRGEVMDYLQISKHRLRAMIALGWLTPRRWAARGKALYLSTEVVAAKERIERGEFGTDSVCATMAPAHARGSGSALLDTSGEVSGMAIRAKQ